MTRTEYIRQEAARQWDAAERRTPTREQDIRDYLPTPRPRIEDVARTAVQIATALADALGLKDRPPAEGPIDLPGGP